MDISGRCGHILWTSKTLEFRRVDVVDAVDVHAKKLSTEIENRYIN